MDIPRVKQYPASAVQCDDCGGNGCGTCKDQGWLTPMDHPKGRRCARTVCSRPLWPNNVAVYCSNECAALDA